MNWWQQTRSERTGANVATRELSHCMSSDGLRRFGPCPALLTHQQLYRVTWVLPCASALFRGAQMRQDVSTIVVGVLNRAQSERGAQPTLMNPNTELVISSSSGTSLRNGPTTHTTKRPINKLRASVNLLDTQRGQLLRLMLLIGPF